MTEWEKMQAGLMYNDFDADLFDRRVARYRKKGGVLDIWTLQSEEEIASFRDKADILTFQFLPEDALNRLLQEPNSPDEAN